VNSVLEKYILRNSEETGNRYRVPNRGLYDRIKNTSLGKIIELSFDDNGLEDINNIVKKYLIRSEKQFFNSNLKVQRFSNVRDECINLLQSFKGYLVTRNPLLETTMCAILGINQDASKLLGLNLWVKSGEAIFLLDRIKHIDICCNHPLTLDWFKSNLFQKNHLFRNQIIDLFTNITQHISQKKPYSFSELAKIHYQFLCSITTHPIENILQELPDKQVNVYQYIGILEDLVNDAVKMQDENHSIQVITPEELPWVGKKKKIWIGGLNSEFLIDQTFLRGLSERVCGISEHIFYNGEFCYSDPSFSSYEVVDKKRERPSAFYEYVPPCPPRELRKNTFAINHVTKLLNNPHNFYVENILKLKSQNFHPNHILGIMVHAVFEELIKETNIFKDFEYTLAVSRSLLRKNHFSQADYLLISKKSEIMVKHLFEVLKDAVEVYAEHEGVQKIIHNGKEYFLHGRADLIYQKNGKYGVIDFKTGNPPSWFNIVNGSAPQIPIAMLMLRFGGFLEKPHTELGESGFISPKGLLKIEHDAFILDSAISGISKLITAFWEEERGYHHHVDPSGPYRIIARQVVL
jgi:hypothetical protein